MPTTRSARVAIATFATVGAFALAAPFALADTGQGGGGGGRADKITICHATASSTNPYTENTVDPSSAVFFNGHAGHEDDIIPAYGDFAGQNLETGAALLANGCKAPTANQAPVVLVHAEPVTVDEGTTIVVSGSFSDPDGDALTLTADNAAGSFTDNGDGTWTLTLPTDDDVALASFAVKATDGGGLSATDGTAYSARNVAPTVSLSKTASQFGCSVTATTSWTDPGVADTFAGTVSAGATSAAVAGNPSSAAFSFINAGTYAVSTTVTDDDGGVGTAAVAGGHTVYNIPGPILQPINFTGPRSEFKLGSTIPVKIRVTNCGGSVVSTLTPTVSVAQAGVAGSTTSTAAPKVATTMRIGGEQYIYNLATKPLGVGEWVITITDPTFVAPVTGVITVKN